MRKIIFVFLFSYVSFASFAQENITAFEVKNFIGEICTITGKIDNLKIIENDKGGVIFIHFEKPYPNNPCKLVIFGKNRSKFPSNLEEYYEQKTVKITGKITEDKYGNPQIIVNEPSEITLIE